MTVAEELENRRRCCYGLAGVMVSVDDEPGAVAVSATRWGDGGVLELELADGRVVPADRLPLLPLARRLLRAAHAEPMEPDPAGPPSQGRKAAAVNRPSPPRVVAARRRSPHA